MIFSQLLHQGQRMHTLAILSTAIRYDIFRVESATPSPAACSLTLKKLI
jgi:hypothetical protein